MPPPMPNPSKRMTANPARPVQRYRPGKAVGQSDSSDESEEEADEPQQLPQRKAPPPQRRPQRPHAAPQDESEDDDEEGFVTEDEDDDGGVPITESTTTGTGMSTRAALTSANALDQGEEESEDEESDSEEEASSEDESSSEDEPQRKFQRPTFIRKSDRNPLASEQHPATAATPITALSGGLISTPQPASEEDEVARRHAATEALIADRIERDALARAAGKKSWDDDDEVAPENMVDDTDGVDPEAEYAAWKLRELKRLKRDREAIETREREIEELERRKGLTAEEREKEDKEYISKQREEHDAGRGQTAYLARYHHKGAFFQDDEAAELLRKRDIMGAKFVDEVDKERLPEYMRIRDMTKLGKKGRTRYTDLKGQDTGAFGNEVMRWRPGDTGGMGGRDGIAGVDERFLPDRDGGGTGPTGANASIVGERRKVRERSRSRSPRRREDVEGGNSYRPRARSTSYSRSPSRRKRSPSPYRDRDKRRRIDAV